MPGRLGDRRDGNLPGAAASTTAAASSTAGAAARLTAA